MHNKLIPIFGPGRTAGKRSCCDHHNPFHPYVLTALTIAIGLFIFVMDHVFPSYDPKVACRGPKAYKTCARNLRFIHVSMHINRGILALAILFDLLVMVLYIRRRRTDCNCPGLDVPLQPIPQEPARRASVPRESAREERELHEFHPATLPLYYASTDPATDHGKFDL